MKKNLFFILGIAVIFSVFSCEKILTPEERFVKDTQTIENYLEENNLEADTILDNGLQAIIETPGEGTAHPALTSKVKVVYKGYLPNDLVFDESSSDGIEFTLNQVIQGWQSGIRLFKKNGKGKLFIPSHLGYGSSSPGSIPSHSVLIFDVELLDF